MKIKNPCRNCEKASRDMVNDLEYGCFNPCQRAEDFFEHVGKTIDDLIRRVNELLGESEVTDNAE